MYNEDYKKIKIKFILNIDIAKYISLNDSFDKSSFGNKNVKEKRIKTFKGFREPINCISQSKKDGNILISCYDGNIILLTEPIIENILELNNF